MASEPAEGVDLAKAYQDAQAAAWHWDVRRLEDIGLTERECRCKGAKWFWRV
jgi:hypothetical protein